jgi:flagellar basal body P-ring formation protein FlgA
MSQQAPKIMTAARSRSAQGYVLAIVALLSAANAAGAVEWQPPATIKAAAVQFATTTLAGRDHVEITTAALDERLKLPRCATDLVATTRQPLTQGQGTVAVSCAEPTAWTLFVPVRASYRVPVLTAAASLASGQVLGVADLRVEYRDAQGLPYAYLSRPDDALGAQLRRTVPAGAVIGPAMIEQPRVVVRGQKVTLLAGASGIVVKSDGVALEDAAVSQRVRVKTRSGRTVDGVVAATGEVRVGPQKLLPGGSKP